MKHTYLFREGIWIAQGFFWDEKSDKAPFKGDSKITHTEDIWENRSRMTLSGEQAVVIESHYQIIPFEDGKDYTNWTSVNPGLGKLTGKFVIVDDSILSIFRSLDGQHTGSEYLQRLDDNNYLNRGFLFVGEVRKASWAAELTRNKGG